MNIKILSTVNKEYIIKLIMLKTPSSSSCTSGFLIMLLLTGVIPTLTSISLIDTEGFPEKQGLKQNSENDDYQDMYKQRDFEKYLSQQYEVHKEYTDYYDFLLNGNDNSEENPSIITDEDFKEIEDDDNDKTEKKQSNNNIHNDDDDDDGKDKFPFGSDWKKDDIATDETDSSSSDKRDEENSYKNIKVIECSSLNINAYEVADMNELDSLLNKATMAGNENNQMKNNNKETQEYNLGSETKIIFICNNENKNVSPSNDYDMINLLPNQGIILPINSEKNNDDNDDNNNNNNNDFDVTTTIR
jgi:hypothetical protein